MIQYMIVMDTVHYCVNRIVLIGNAVIIRKGMNNEVYAQYAICLINSIIRSTLVNNVKYT